MTAENSKDRALKAENQALREQLGEANETLRAIHQGEVDALVVSSPEGPKVYTLTGAETPYRLLIEEMREGAVMLCDDNSILYCNRGFAEMVQVPLDKLIGSNIESVVAQEHLEDFRKLLAACRSGKGAVAKEIAFQLKEGVVPAYVSANSIKADDTTTTFIVATDLSKHMEEDLKKYTQNLESTVRERTKQLQEKERLAAIGQTASMVGHDIRNPLQSIVSELYLAKQELDTLPDSPAKGEVKESLGLIEEQTFYINKIVADLQDYTKPLTPKPQIIEIAGSIHDSLSSSVIPENVAVSIQVADNMPKISADPLYLKRVLVNLISNAQQAMPQGGKLTITANAPAKNKVAISIKDTGLGIPEHVKSQIFQPLFTTKAKGQGLGLAVVKRLTEALNGSVHFESQVGQGTAFIVTLPVGSKESGS